MFASLVWQFLFIKHYLTELLIIHPFLQISVIFLVSNFNIVFIGLTSHSLTEFWNKFEMMPFSIVKSMMASVVLILIPFCIGASSESISSLKWRFSEVAAYFFPKLIRSHSLHTYLSTSQEILFVLCMFLLYHLQWQVAREEQFHCDYNLDCSPGKSSSWLNRFKDKLTAINSSQYVVQKRKLIEILHIK